MHSPKNIKKVQKLIGRLAALNRFISQELTYVPHSLQWGSHKFEWNMECEPAFQELKIY